MGRSPSSGPRVRAARSDESRYSSGVVLSIEGQSWIQSLEPKPRLTNVGATAGDPRKEKSCWDFRDHGSCRKGRDCPFSHDKELRRRELEKKGAGKGEPQGSESYPANGDGKGKQDERGGGKGNAKKGGDDKGKPKEGKQCPFFAKKGFCKKGAACDMVHLLTATTTAAGEGSVGALPAGWGALSGAHLTNPFGAFVVVSGKPVSACPA